MYSLMIVDDSLIIRRKIERNTDCKKFRIVASVGSGAEALEVFPRCRPQLVTMDLTMPGMDGIECIKKLITIDPEVRILVVSALSDKATGIRALKEGALGFLCKPFGDEQLFEALIRLAE